MKTPKILFILHLPPPIHGASIVGKIIKESRVINEDFFSRYINLGISHSVNEIGKYPLGKVWRYMILLCKVLWSLIKFRPDLCYITINSGGVGFYKDFPLVFFVGLFGVKRVYHFHNKGIAKYHHHWIDNKLYRFVFHKSLVILLSKYLYPDIQKYIPLNRVYYCPNGIAEINAIEIKNKKLHKDDRTKAIYNKQEDVVEILFLSNLIVTKGVFVLLEACKILKEKGITFHCTFVGGEGDINLKQLNETIEKLGLIDCVFYVGKKYGNEKEEFFNAASIFVLPTLNDCFPLVLLEAMQYSLPIVSTTEGAICELVEDNVNGFLVPKEDSLCLAQKLEVLLTNKELRLKMGSAGRVKYEREFTLDIFENRMKNILKKIVNR